jgi:hypothetical protein
MTDDDEPITLAEACQLYPRAKLTISTLRAEAARGRLDIFRLGKRDYTTPAAMREMVRKCQDAGRHRASILTQNVSNESSATARALSAQAALRETVVALRQNLPRISGRSLEQRAASKKTSD